MPHSEQNVAPREISGAEQRRTGIPVDERDGAMLSQQPPTYPPSQMDTFQQSLRKAVGRFIVADFLIGTTAIVRRTGILSSVGQNYLVLYNPCSDQYTTCEIYSAKFITVYPENTPPIDVICTYNMISSMNNI